MPCVGATPVVGAEARCPPPELAISWCGVVSPLPFGNTAASHKNSKQKASSCLILMFLLSQQAMKRIASCLQRYFIKPHARNVPVAV